MHYACPVLFRLYRTLASPILAPDYAIYCRRKNDALFFPKIKYLFPPIHSDAAAHTLVVVHYRVIGLWGVNRKSLPLFGRFRPSSRSRAGGGCKVEGNERRKRWPIFQPSSSSSIIIAYSLAPLQWCNTAETAHASVVSPVDVLARERVCVCVLLAYTTTTHDDDDAIVQQQQQLLDGGTRWAVITHPGHRSDMLRGWKPSSSYVPYPHRRNLSFPHHHRKPRDRIVGLARRGQISRPYIYIHCYI